jgi:hypothetical protein
VSEARYQEIAGSGLVRVATRADVSKALVRREAMIERDVSPLEGTNMSLFNSIIPNWWEQNVTGTFAIGGAALAESVWVANICKHMNAQQISAMPIEFHGASEPSWVSSPDPNIFPNGIGDAVFAIVDQLYGWGFSCQYVTDFYADGFARTWTVMPSAAVSIRWENGARAYKLGEQELDPARVVQIDRNPGTGLHGTSAMAAFAQPAWGLLAAQNQSMTVSQGGIPKFYLKSERKLTKEQAEALQLQWATATSNRNGGMPPVVPPEIVPTEMSFDPASMALLETQEWDARVLANAFGVPSVLLNMSLQGGLTYQNPMALMQMWWLKELRTTAKRIGDAFSAQMLPRGQWISFDASDITTDLTADSAANDEQASQVAKASPAQQPGRLTAVGT